MWRDDPNMDLVEVASMRAAKMASLDYERIITHNDSETVTPVVVVPTSPMIIPNFIPHEEMHKFWGQVQFLVRAIPSNRGKFEAIHLIEFLVRMECMSRDGIIRPVPRCHGELQ
ncbi:hypothetical protein HAX54_017386 [Datura stramonium]|uniref:Uncharacterized protein n=1 Tax=Datura stramonium TaxID=4076 RepID=A0ABS8S149_DATST|nr:hypothetical protein [Datura stramonium]